MNDWISVKDRLPDKNGFYLVSRGDIVSIVCFSGGEWYSYNANLITHWMPLPRPAKESEVK